MHDQVHDKNSKKIKEKSKRAAIGAFEGYRLQKIEAANNDEDMITNHWTELMLTMVCLFCLIS